ncbi:MAG: T9SS type A sorting domain-containing protein [Saprospiraceae bacterium]|nr:T9SS type A sorting domain-containing protein [Saprospiraceae bacterium]
MGIKLFEIGANYRYEMINLMGVTVSVGKIENEISVDVSSIANGVYMVKIMKDDKPIDFKKLIIQK